MKFNNGEVGGRDTKKAVSRMGLTADETSS